MEMRIITLHSYYSQQPRAASLFHKVFGFYYDRQNQQDVTTWAALQLGAFGGPPPSFEEVIGLML